MHEARHATNSEETRIAIDSEADVVTARQRGRALAVQLGFYSSDLAVIATAISEVARNIFSYAGRGEIICRAANKRGRRGLVVIACDDGPGISDVAQAMQEGFSTTHSLGMGLPGARRLMDEFEITSAPGQGTTVTMAKWVR
jgi:serine/threonine-protein kinase RsbT